MLLLLLSYAFSSELACIPDDGSAIAWFAIVTCFVAVFLRLFAKTTKDGDDDDDSLPPPIERELFLVVNCNAPRHGDFVLQSAVASPRRRPMREKGPPRPRKDDDDVVVICVVVVVVKSKSFTVVVSTRAFLHALRKACLLCSVKGKS